MYAEIKTTITSRVEIVDGGFGDVEHSVEIDTGTIGAGLPQNAIFALVQGGARSLLISLGEGA